MGGYLRHRAHRAEGDVAEPLRRLGADQRGPRLRPDAVGRDQRRGFQRTLRRIDPDQAAGVLKRAEFAVGDQLHPFPAARLDEHLVQVGAVDHGIGLAVAPAHLLAHRETQQGLAGHRVGEHAGLGQAAAVEDLLLDPEVPEGMVRVRAELDAVADRAELARLLDDADRAAGARERDRGAQPADAAARDDDLGLLRHGLLPGALRFRQCAINPNAVGINLGRPTGLVHFSAGTALRATGRLPRPPASIPLFHLESLGNRASARVRSQDRAVATVGMLPCALFARTRKNYLLLRCQS